MKINTNELKKFKSNASFIKQNSILPILGYLKFDNGKVYKTNLNCFIVQDIDFKGSFLVEEHILFNFLKYTEDATIDISVKGNRVIISDSKNSVASPTDDIKNFSAIPDAGEDKVNISNEVFSAINIASNFIEYMDAPDMRAHVFVGNNLIAGCNGFIGYTEKSEDKLPKIVLSKDDAIALGKFNSATFSENESYIFLETDTTLYGFIKPTYPFADLSKIAVLDKKYKSFVVDKQEVLNFSELCISSTKAKGLLAKMAIVKGKLTLSMSDADFSVDVNRSVSVSGEMEGSFNFNPALMATVLRNLPDNELTFQQANGAYLMTGETGFVSIIQQLA